MPGAARLGKDRARVNGTIFTGACSVIINGSPAARLSDKCVPHVPYKGLHKFPQPIIKGSCSVIIEGKPAARMGDITLCGCPVNIGSCDVVIGG